MPVGGEPTAEENAALAEALLRYSRRTTPDDFLSLTAFANNYPRSPWTTALLTGLGLEYYNTAHYSKALAAWQNAWTLVRNESDPRNKAVADRVGGELAYMYARLGRMEELETFLKSVEHRVFTGSASEKIAGAKEGLWNMKNRPEIAFRCGPLALHRLTRMTGTQGEADMVIFKSASTQKGFSLTQVAELSKKVGLDYQMAYRSSSKSEIRNPKSEIEFVVPSVVHWKVGHYAAMVRQEGDKYLLEDPTFGNTVWATREALEAETSGYFLIPPGALPKGWRSVEAKEGDDVWGKGFTNLGDAGSTACDDPQSGGSNPCQPPCLGAASGSPFGDGSFGAGIGSGSAGLRMAASSVNLMLVSLSLSDAPVGYTPPVGPSVEFLARYSHREAFQPTTFTYANLGPKWTCNWISYITDNPQNTLADVNHYLRGGGTRTFTGFKTNLQIFAIQQKTQTQLTRTGPASYQMMAGDGSKLIFNQSDGSVGTSRKIFLTQVVDPYTNAVNLAYDSSLRLISITDAIGQVTTLSYSNATFTNAITRVTDPFGRFASFDYDSQGRLTNITDVIGIQSRFIYAGSSDYVTNLITPYGTNTFIRGEAGTTRWLETVYADGSRDRVEFNQSTNLGVGFSDLAASVPQGMNTQNQYLWYRNTFYWSRTACATAYGDYTKAKLYHWLHTEDVNICAGILESTKEALEGRVWYDYDGQGSPIFVGSTDQPRHVGRVLDDGSTQLYTYQYNQFGNVTNSIDPLGRTFSYLYASNGIDLLEVRMTRAGKNELLSKTTYNAQHLPLTTAGADGQTTTNTYNARGQLLTTTNPKGETTTYTYDSNGYLIAVDGPLPGTNDTSTASYDLLGRLRTTTDVDGYTVINDYDALDRPTKITFPDSTFYQITYNRLEPSVIQDRAGRQTLLEHDALGNLAKRTDPLGRATLFQWCNCGSIKSLTDPMGRTTQWHTDVQGRLVAKQYGDGSKVSYSYENASGRLRQVVDEKLQVKQFAYNRDNTLRSISYLNAAVPTPAVSYTYDPDYERQVSMTDGTGTTLYSYSPITGSPALGAGKLASVDGPLANDTITYIYDELGRRVTTAINGVASALTYDAAGRVVGETNALGSFNYAYDGSSGRVLLETFPNGQTTSRTYDDNLHDRALTRITHQVGATPVSDFIYGYDLQADRITTWSQQFGAQSPFLYTFGYDAVNQLLSATVTNAGVLTNTFAYTYDPAGNRLSELAGGTTTLATHNALNQLNVTTGGPGASRTNEWDGEDQLVAVISGNQRTEFAYDGLSRLASIRKLVNSSEVSLRRLVWSDGEICEERDASGAVIKRFFKQGTRIETGTNSGSYYYTRDLIVLFRYLTDGSGTLRARYSYDPFGRRTRLSGDLDADLGFTGMFWSDEAGLPLTRFRAYDPTLGRWLSRDPLTKAEIEEGANLYAYVRNNPINMTDPLGLCCEKVRAWVDYYLTMCAELTRLAPCHCAWSYKNAPDTAFQECAEIFKLANEVCTSEEPKNSYKNASEDLFYCVQKPCDPCDPDKYDRSKDKKNGKLPPPVPDCDLNNL